MSGEGGNITIGLPELCDNMRRLMRLQADIAAELKEFELQGKASGHNMPAVKKWLKAEVQDEGSENPNKIAKLIEQTVDQVVYGESLGHDLGILQNNQHREDRIVENVSNPETVELLSTVADAMQTDTGRKALITALDVMIEHEEDSTRAGATPPPSPSATGDTAATVSPTHSHPGAIDPRTFGSTGEGGASYALASPVIQTGASHGDDDLDPPAHMVRANWVDGMPPR